MSNIEALDKLIEAVEAGSVENDGTMFRLFGDAWLYCYDGYHGSLDAAMSLKDALLPHWAIQRLTMWPGPTPRCAAELWGTHDKGGERWHSFGDGQADAEAANIARALLLATLKAWRAKLEAEQ